MQLSVVIPTYNERENIPKLLECLSHTLKGLKFEVIIIDDNSPDGTAEVVEQLSMKYPVRIIVRKGERDLSSAVMAGIASAKTQNVCIMDADLQHPPQIILKFHEIFKQKNVDIAIGSRYIKGGSIQSWKLSRRIISSIATKLSRILLPKIRSVKDPLSGFFMVRKSIISNRLHPRGYKILLEILVRCKYGEIVEIPYSFSARKSGGSKLGRSQILKFLKQLKRLIGKPQEMNKND